MDSMKTNLESLVPKILKVACQKGIPKMDALLNACVEEEDLDEEARLSDGKNNVLKNCSTVLFHSLQSQYVRNNPRYICFTS